MTALAFLRSEHAETVRGQRGQDAAGVGRGMATGGSKGYRIWDLLLRIRLRYVAVPTQFDA